MTDNQTGTLLSGLWLDAQQPAILWQVGTLALCLVAAALLGRRLQWRVADDSTATLKRGAAAFRRVAFPLLATLLLLAGRAVLAYWHGTHLLSVAIPLFGALAAIRFAVYLLQLAFTRAAWLDAFERTIATTIWLLLVLHLTGLLPELIAWLSGIEMSIGKNSLSLWALLSIAFWVGLTVLLALWAGAALEARLMGAESLNSSTRVVAARVAKAGLLILAVLVVLPLAGVDLTVLSVFGGALGVGLGFGLQKIASNYLSGFIILLDRSIRLGDMITADGHHGQVTRITTRYVVLRLLSGVEALIPNDALVTTTVLNHSYTDRRVRHAVRVQVAYDTDLPAAFRAMLGIARAHARVLKEPEPTVHVVQLGDSGVELELGFWIEDPENGSQNVRSDISVELLSEFRARGIEIPYPQRHIRVLQGNNPEGPGNSAKT